MRLYAHQSIAHSIKTRADFETERVECIQLEAKPSASSAILVGYVYTNPAVTHVWYDDFVKMMDKANESNSNIVLLRDFSINLLKSQPAWGSKTSLSGLRQRTRCATRITQTTATLLDHIYRNNEHTVSNAHVSYVMYELSLSNYLYRPCKPP